MATDNGNDGNDFAEFEAAGKVEVGESNLASQKGKEGEEGGEGDPEPKPAKTGKSPTPRPKPAPKAAPKVESNQPGGEGDDGGEGSEGDDGGEGGEEKPATGKKTQTPSERIRELNKRLRQEERLRLASDARLVELEKVRTNGGSTGAEGGGNSVADIGPAPDPSDTAKYPLGHLDDRYIEDKLEYLATLKAGEKADAVLQREQEIARTRQAEAAQTALLEKVDDLAVKGSEIFDDYQEEVVEAGMRGDWALGQPTFEAAHEAENGHVILYNLSQDKAEAKRVAALSPFSQLKYVMEKDAEISAKNKGRKIPKAGEPPATNTRGTSSRTTIKPDTDNLDDFGKAWDMDAKS